MSLTFLVLAVVQRRRHGISWKKDSVVSGQDDGPKQSAKVFASST